MQSKNVIKTSLENYKENELIFASQLYRTKLYNKMTEAAFYKSIERMCKSGELIKISKGTYHLPKNSKYGVVPPSDKEIISAFTRNGTGTIVGYSLYNSLNLTTQVAKSIELMSSSIDGFTKTIRNIIIHQVEIDYSENVVNMINCLEVLQNYYNIQDLNNLAFKKYTEEVAKFYDEETFTKVIKTINYRKSTIAFLQEILNYYGVKNNLSSYLSCLTEYKFPKMEEINEIARI